MITWGLICFLVLVGLFIACTTAPLPGVPAPQQMELPVPTDEGSSLSAEELERLVERAEALLEEKKQLEKKQAEKKLEEMMGNLYGPKTAE